MVVGQLSQVNASVATDFGAVQFSWSRKPSLTVEVTVPVGILAYLFVPVADGTMRSCDGQPFGEGLHSVVAGSGKYRRFTVPSGAHTMAVEREAVSGEFIV
ncbi:pebA [Symbiodinium sp. CCMP2456]|nr:pebA [Symbiodinium sp. CCMP2456]